MNEHHDLRLKTSLPYERVANMLTTCCSKLYSMTLDGFEETKSGPRKVTRISFGGSGRPEAVPGELPEEPRARQNLCAAATDPVESAHQLSAF